jgi:predicted TIM-barrel fold metal-dependent hydrolase
MDESGVDTLVLSVTTPGLHNLEPEESVDLALRTNDLLAATIAKYSTRFQGFTVLPTAAGRNGLGGGANGLFVNERLNTAGQLRNVKSNH